MLQSKLSQYRSLFKTYSTNFEYFEQYKANHRLHQKEALEAIETANIGQVLSPCGTGKTRIQISVHVQDMINKSTNNQFGVYLIASHRLTLNVQLFDQLIDVCVNSGLPFNILFVGSYHCDFSKYYEKYANLGFSTKTCNCLATTNKKEIDDFINQSKDRHVIIVSTYHSFDQLKNISKIDICTYDEAHNTISVNFTENIKQVKPNIKREYFFTATRKIRGEDDGMNDRTFYGEVLYDAFPNLMLRSGEICCPRVHIIDAEDNKNETSIVNIHMLIKNLIEGFEKHREFIKEKSVEPDKINPTMLVSCSGIKEMMNIYNHEEFKSYVKENNIKALAISFDGCLFNYDPCNKQAFLKNLNAIKDMEEAIIFNVDMLTEGIDLPSITGVMPLRNMSNIKLIQLLGRCLRLHREDRQNLYAGIFDPCEYSSYIKPYGWLIIPRHLTALTEHKTMLDTVKLVINEYQTLAEEIVVQEQFIDPNHQELDSIIQYPLNGKKDFNLAHSSANVVSKINIESFREALQKQGTQGKIKYLTDMLNKYETSKSQEQSCAI